MIATFKNNKIFIKGFILKRGIALLITITLVAAIAALIGISAGILNQSFKRISNKQFLIQTNSFMSGIIDVMNEATQDVNDSMSLDIFLSLPYVIEQKSRGIEIDVTFTSEANGLNPNLMLQDVNKSEEETLSYDAVPIATEFERYFDRILTIYNVSDKILLLSLIADTVDEDLDERTSGSELAVENPFFSQGHIYSIEHFEQILEAYKKATLDFSVDLIPWEKLLTFRSDTIDLNHVEPEAFGALFPEMDASAIAAHTTDRIDTYEDFAALGVAGEQQAELKKLGADFYAPQVKAWMNIHSGENYAGITFLYDLESKKVSHIEITN